VPPFGAGLGRREAQKKRVAGAGWRTPAGSRAEPGKILGSHRLAKYVCRAAEPGPW
jgi:hypothetical protein